MVTLKGKKLTIKNQVSDLSAIIEGANSDVALTFSIKEDNTPESESIEVVQHIITK